MARTAFQDEVEKRPDLYHELRRRGLPVAALEVADASFGAGAVAL